MISQTLEVLLSDNIEHVDSRYISMCAITRDTITIIVCKNCESTIPRWFLLTGEWTKKMIKLECVCGKGSKSKCWKESEGKNETQRAEISSSTLVPPSLYYEWDPYGTGLWDFWHRNKREISDIQNCLRIRTKCECPVIATTSKRECKVGSKQ